MLNTAVGVRNVVMTVLPLLLAFSPAGKNFLRNGDFERFKGNDPEGWETTNIAKVLTVVSPSPRAHGGKFAVRCEVKDFFGSKMAGMVCQKDVPVIRGSMQMIGYFVLRSVGNDAGFVAFDLQNAEGNTVKLFEQNLTEPTDEFKMFALTISVPSSAEHLCLRCTLLPGKGSESLHEGSFVLFDDLQLFAVPQEGEKILP